MFIRGKRYPQERCFKVTKLTINNFRRFSNQSIEIGPNITLIVGQNGTSKSTLLGLIAHPFSTKNDDTSVYVRHYGNELEGLKTINNKNFTADYRQMFRMEKEFDKPGNHKYRIFIQGPGLLGADETNTIEIPVKSKSRGNATQSQVRLVAGKTHNVGEGNFPHPVIYLGLGRLAPLAECRKMSVAKSETILTEEETEWLHKKNNEILTLNEEPVGIDILDSGLPGKGAFPASSYRDYNPATYSAGQDNLGQILIALLSFKRLKKKLGDKYAGGLLFVDELDAALFPSAQTRLLEILAEESQLLGIQIIATTHSVTMMHYVFHSEVKHYAEIVFLRKVDDRVEVESNITYQKIKSNLLIEYNPSESPSLFFEDQRAISFFNAITLNLFNLEYELICVGSAGVLSNIASREKLQKKLSGVSVLDADQASPNKLKNVVFLPGHKIPLESELYFFLKNLSDTDVFWNPDKGFTKQLLFKKHQYSEYENADNHIKSWYKEQNMPEWGDDGKLAMERWIKAHSELCYEFCQSLIKSIRTTVTSAPKLDEIEKQLKAQYSPTVQHTRVNEGLTTDGLTLFEYAERNTQN